MKSMLRATVALIATAACSVTLAKPINAVLRLNEKVPIENLAYYAKSRSTPMTGFYSAKDIRAISGPSDVEYAQLLKDLNRKGFEIVKESPTHLWITVRGEASLFEDVFTTRISYTANGLHQYNGHYTVPQDLSLVAAVTGLDNTRQSRTHYRFLPKQNTHWGFSGIEPDTIRKVYGFDKIYSSGIDASGQHIAIATYDGFEADNVTTYYSKMSITPTPAVDQVQFNGNPAYNSGSAGETELDAELSGMIAPGAQIHVFASAENSDAGELQMFTAILDDGRAHIVNYSWGGCEKSVEAAHQQEMEKVFSRAVAQGVNIFVATGDSGSDSCGDGGVTADWPAGNANIVAVGGTSLSVSGSKGSETAWDGSGGGISGLFDLPNWQATLGGKYTKRSYPDVAFNADPYTGQAVWVGGGWFGAGWQVVGGTSMAAPQWAGFMALVNASRVKNNQAPLGFLNPLIYGMNDKDRAAAFNDITSGSNGGYKAGQGWDAVTGLGSMRADVLLKTLNQQ